MDEATFDIDPRQLAETSHRFPSRPLAHAEPRPAADLGYLAQASGFGRHAWDEGGSL